MVSKYYLIIFNHEYERPTNELILDINKICWQDVQDCLLCEQLSENLYRVSKVIKSENFTCPIKNDYLINFIGAMNIYYIYDENKENVHVGKNMTYLHKA